MSMPTISFQIFAQGNQLQVYQTLPTKQPVTVTNGYMPANGNPSYQFKRTPQAEVQLRHSSGIVITTSWLSNKYMNVIYQVPGNFENSGRVRGFFGNFDGRTDNEFAYCDNPGSPVTSANYNSHQQYNVLITCKSRLHLVL